MTVASQRPTRAAPHPSRTRSQLGRPQRRAALILIVPFLVVFVGMFVIPLLYSLYLSTFKSTLAAGETFSGVGNYVRALTDPSFWSGMSRVALFLVIQVPIMLALSIAFALAIDSGRLRGAKIVRLAVFVPYAVPGVVATLLWGYLYGPDFGLITQIARALLLPPPNLLSSGNILGATMNIVSWEFIGYNVIVLYSALRSVPTELYDAAEMDGASQWRIAWSIKIPAIRSAIILTVIFSIIGSFQLFSEPALLTSIAPNAIGNDFTPNLYAYNVAFKNQDINYAAAIAFLLGVVVMIVSYVVQLITNRKGTDS